MSNSLVIVTRPYDVSVAPVDAFVTRRHQVLAALRKHFDLKLVLLRQPHDDTRPRADLAACVQSEVAIPVLDMRRTHRLRRSAGRLLTEEAPGAISEAVRKTGATRAVTFGPWLKEQFQPVFSTVPTLHFFEEDLTRMHEIAPQSAQARLLRRVEARLSSAVSPQPRAVVHIGLLELESARAAYPRAKHLWYPYLLEEEEWPVTHDPPGSEGVLVVGNFKEARNAEGLAEVLSAAERYAIPPVEVISAAGLHDDLQSYADRGVLRHLQDVVSPYSAYRRSRVTVVPARRVTGIKTTVLQAWAAGCPVVCFRPSAASVGPWAAHALLIGETGEQLVKHVRDLLADRTAAADLAARGRALLLEHFDVYRREQELLAVVAGLTE